MAEKNTGVPPANLSGISRPGRGAAVVKPKNMKGTLGRLQSLPRDGGAALDGFSFYLRWHPAHPFFLLM